MLVRAPMRATVRVAPSLEVMMKLVVTVPPLRRWFAKPQAQTAPVPPRSDASDGVFICGNTLPWTSFCPEPSTFAFGLRPLGSSQRRRA